MTEDNEKGVTPLHPAPPGVGTFHGPVEVESSTEYLQVITFVGAEESDVLHAAGAWMGEHLHAVLLSVNWVGDFLSPYDEDHDGPPRHRLDITVDRSYDWA